MNEAQDPSIAAGRARVIDADRPIRAAPVGAGLIAEHRDGTVVVRHKDLELARYAYVVDAPAPESPKPYLHPVRTLAGDVVTGYRPHGHRWHKGLQLTCTDLSGTNLWGGPTWVEGEGYSVLDNHGRMEPIGVVEVTSADGVTLSHELSWRSAGGEELVRERRSLSFSLLDGASAWSLDWSGELTNATGVSLRFGSPATLGHAGSGYSGLVWRGPRAFIGGHVLLPSGPISAEAARGSRAAWLAFCGEHDEVDRSSTLVFEPTVADDLHETRWFVRSEEFPTVNPSWAYDSPFELGSGETLRIGHRVIVASGALTVEEIEAIREAARG